MDAVAHRYPLFVMLADACREAGVGYRIAARLARAGEPVRVLVRRPSRRTRTLVRLGVEVIPADPVHLGEVRSALRGCRAACFAYTMHPGLLDAATTFATAARELGLGHAVHVSQLESAPDSPALRLREHWLAEQVMDWAGIDVLHLQPGLLTESLLRHVAYDVAQGEEIRLPLGDGECRLPLIAAEDVAAIVAGLLREPGLQPAPSRRLALATEVPTVAGLVDRLAATSELPLRYRPVSAEGWRTLVRHRARPNSDYSLHTLPALWEAMTYPRLDGHPPLREAHALIARLSGREPRRLGELARRRVPLWLAERRDTGAAGGALTAGERRQLEDYIEAHLTEPITVADLGRLLGRDRHALHRAFQKAFHRSPHRYVVERRVARARALLEQGDLPLSEIALAAGFSSQSHMTTVFKRVTGLPPGRYRRSTA
ncbi:helix-turn-helix domain-containing protein [Spiribacter halobius]|uniref:HTH araC/xylS-type domain-containing protein n=1 Tax=Sediminicurvatus halobius TaxID=2182432 RepID=A0A2U2N3A3_9GAMM|nr:helix-turn-helix domain-containing protein [Spiribacter halobius]PWG63547.1 hypothetical protein DEM34_08290 [Spiribacter halobius]UEX79573.1 helix-turn-helix domain-containing protein [Spiribacter halobius]